MTVAVLKFGGSNCDRDAVQALADVGVDAELVWYKEGLPTDVSGVLLPGGFSYGDYLRAGAMAARDPIVEEVRERAGKVPILGVCNGAQIGSEAGLTPGAFTVNRSARFQCEHVHLRVETTDTPFTAAFDEGDVVSLPIAHGEGRFETESEAAYEELVATDRVLFRYCDADGNVTDEANPNGSRGNVAGVVGADRTTAVLMPHPERAALADLHAGTDGRGVLEGFA
ncbi:phosphoribosylformylglycinamidine synthase I [Salinirubellus salinus]|uniref:Phosphoribosylformylglycinamidine synthase subunit PurQ n=1 Tax=Salinirubellus salinus TaxID=1364945 RepID=A0A9E7R034_9EURY|nr:phosphoribosylformylglycinamidine synthase I [Salinirubellus salinus]UWM52839.1 phosphoribosylformylglycinamidine synthase I [Salinirubellus salinus]